MSKLRPHVDLPNGALGEMANLRYRTNERILAVKVTFTPLSSSLRRIWRLNVLIATNVPSSSFKRRTSPNPPEAMTGHERRLARMKDEKSVQPCLTRQLNICLADCGGPRDELLERQGHRRITDHFAGHHIKRRRIDHIGQGRSNPCKRGPS